jgi:hypothetical protein
MTSNRIVSRFSVESIEGHQFPGGIYTIEHWENFLMTECTGSQLMQNGVVHPVALFHVPIIGSGTSIAKMFALGQAESDLSISIESYDWEMHHPLKEDVAYHVNGRVVSAERRQNEHGHDYDRIQFRFEMTEPDGELAARTTIIWHYARSGRSG